jgi:hypothetical protein
VRLTELGKVGRGQVSLIAIRSETDTRLCHTYGPTQGDLMSLWQEGVPLARVEALCRFVRELGDDDET